MTSPQTTEAIQTITKEFEDAWSAKSAPRLAGIYTKNGQLLPPNSPIVSGSDEIQSFWQGVLDNSGVASINLNTVDIDELGDTAIEVGLFTMKAADGAVVDNGKYMVIWKKEADQWKYYRDIWSSSNATAAS